MRCDVYNITCVIKCLLTLYYIRAVQLLSFPFSNVPFTFSLLSIASSTLPPTPPPRTPPQSPCLSKHFHGHCAGIPRAQTGPSPSIPSIHPSQPLHASFCVSIFLVTTLRRHSGPHIPGAEGRSDCPPSRRTALSCSSHAQLPTAAP